MTALIDSDVLIDCLRGMAPAREWLQQSATETFAIPGVVAMELVQGCRNQFELDQVQSFLCAFEIAWPDAQEFSKAYDLLIAHRLHSTLSIPDCLISYMAVSRNAPLYTFNIKHFRIVSGLDILQPYSRQ